MYEKIYFHNYNAKLISMAYYRHVKDCVPFCKNWQKPFKRKRNPNFENFKKGRESEKKFWGGGNQRGGEIFKNSCYQSINHLICIYLDDLEAFLGIWEVQDSKFSPSMVDWCIIEIILRRNKILDAGAEGE